MSSSSIKLPSAAELSVGLLRECRKRQRARSVRRAKGKERRIDRKRRRVKDRKTRAQEQERTFQQAAVREETLMLREEASSAGGTPPTPPPAPEPAFPFGRVLPVGGEALSVPYAHENATGGEEDALQQAVTAQLRSRPLLALLIFTVSRRCFDTVKGHVGLFFATLQGARATHPVVLTHWSLLNRICIQCYSGFSPRSKGGPGVRKSDIQSAFRGLIVTGMSDGDLESMRAVSGADKSARVKQHSHVAVSAHWFRRALRALRDVRDVTSLILPYASEGEPRGTGVFCTSAELTMRDIGSYKDFSISAYKMVMCQQSKVTAAAHFPQGPPNVQPYDARSPSFGVEWSRVQLDRLRDVATFLSPATGVSVDKTQHYKSLYEADESPVRSRDEILAGTPYILDDSASRPPLNNNYRAKQDRLAVKETLRRQGFPIPSRGRPSANMCPVVDEQKRILHIVRTQRGRRVMAPPNTPAVKSTVTPNTTVKGADVPPVDAPVARRAGAMLALFKSSKSRTGTS